MIPRVEKAVYIADYTIHFRFSDGTEGEIDLSDELYGEDFGPLRDLKMFRQFSVHPDFHTLTWANGTDIAPEFLYEKLRVPAKM